MTLQTFAGTWTSRANAGDDVITGVGFTSKVIIVYSGELTNAALNAFQSNYAFHFGVAVGTTATTDQRCLTAVSLDAAATSDVYSAWFRGIICVANNAGTFNAKATISAIGADGFTVTWSVQDAARDYFYLCIGGTDITNVDVDEFSTPASTGDQTISTPGFQPDFLMLFGVQPAATDTASNAGGAINLGFANSTQQCALSVVSEDAVATMDTGRYQRNDKVLVKHSFVDTATKVTEATLSAFTGTGFTLNYTTATNINALGYLAIKGIGSSIGSITSPIVGATPVSQSTTTNTNPTGLMLFSVDNTAQTTLQDNNRLTIGTASDSTHRSTVWCGDQDNVADDVSARYIDTAKVCLIATENATAGSSTKNAVADLSSFDSNGFTLSWSTIDAVNAYEVLFIAFSSTTIAPVAAAAVTTADMGKLGLTPGGMGVSL